MTSLGNWSVIDIETTGIDPTYDQIIDLGYLQFEGTKLVKKYSSLVRTDVKLSKFIEKLTGISQKMVENAPLWDQVENDLLDLDGHNLVAHNAQFEEMFLKKYFDRIDEGQTRESFCDSMYYLCLLFPERSSLNLESFMIDFGIADSHNRDNGIQELPKNRTDILVGSRFRADSIGSRLAGRESGRIRPGTGHSIAARRLSHAACQHNDLYDTADLLPIESR